MRNPLFDFTEREVHGSKLVPVQRRRTRSPACHSHEFRVVHDDLISHHRRRICWFGGFPFVAEEFATFAQEGDDHAASVPPARPSNGQNQRTPDCYLINNFGAL